MIEQFVITSELADKLKARLAELDKKLAVLAEERLLLMRQIEAIPLFLSAKPNGAEPEGGGVGARFRNVEVGGVAAAADAVEVTESYSLPMAVKAVLQKHGRLSPVQIREAILAEGVPREKLGPSNSYLYTVLARLRQSRQVERVRGRYQLPRGVTHQWKPEEADVEK